MSTHTRRMVKGALAAEVPTIAFDYDESYVKAMEKVQSAIRTLFRAMAEASGRDAQIAEAVVDKAIEGSFSRSPRERPRRRGIPTERPTRRAHCWVVIAS